MKVPNYFLRKPAPRVQNGFDFDRLYADSIEHGIAREIIYTLAAPKWEFLSHLCDTKNVLLHGSSNPGILEFEPRQSNDSNEFGNRRAVYAASDGIWPIYFAIVNRSSVKSLVNACFRVLETSGTSEKHYYFSLDQRGLLDDPWRNGTIYILPRDTFEQQPPAQYQGVTTEIFQWASPVAVKPLAKLTVTPEDFPFLHQVNGHDPQVVSERASRNPGGFPWRD